MRKIAICNLQFIASYTPDKKEREEINPVRPRERCYNTTWESVAGQREHKSYLCAQAKCAGDFYFQDKVPCKLEYRGNSK